ncbi:MAG: trypsin-like peptidase domain-containing protein [Sedimentisphaerales bacterium]|nr:trypsin-like peptidase domain-containing protein [Sedimentisphaerales bacterium]
MLDRLGYSRKTIGILKDTKSPTRDFVGVWLEQSSPVQKVGQVMCNVQKTAHVKSYVAGFHNIDKPPSIYDATMADDNSLAFIIKNSRSGVSMAYSFAKIYPHVAATTSESKVEPPKTVSQGTGFAVSPDGHIVTAHHVVEGAKTIKVYLSKDTFGSATILRTDPPNDLAVLKVENTIPVFLPVAPMRSVKTGDRVFTIGFPVRSILGEEAKYTEGVVSSLSGIQDTASFLQITVPVQPGNSGGPLVNEKGEVVGVITSTAAILSFIEESGALPQNVNWAVKADYLRPLIELPTIDKKQLSREEVIASVKKATFLIETE